MPKILRENEAGELELVDVAEDYIAPAEPLPPEPVLYSKRRLFGAMTGDQYAVFAQVEAQQDPRKARIFKESTELSDADPDWPELLAAMVVAFGPDEAGRLLLAARI